MNGTNTVASSYLIKQLQSEVAERVWRAAFAFSVSGSVGPEALPILRERLSNRDVCVRTLCAVAILDGDFSKVDVELAQSTLAGVLCLSDRACPTEFISPSDVGTSHRLVVINVLATSDKELSVYWGPLLVIILSDDPSAIAAILRIRSLQLMSQQKTIPLYARNALNVLANSPQLIGINEVDATSMSLISKMLERRSD